MFVDQNWSQISSAVIWLGWIGDDFRYNGKLRIFVHSFVQLMVSYVFALFCVLVAEYPALNIERLLLHAPSKKVHLLKSPTSSLLRRIMLWLFFCDPSVFRASNCQKYQNKCKKASRKCYSLYSSRWMITVNNSSFNDENIHIIYTVRAPLPISFHFPRTFGLLSLNFS